MEKSSRSVGNVQLEGAVAESLQLPYDSTIQEALRKHEYNFVLCDPRLPDDPIVYASEGFLKMTGYSAQEVLGRNCRFLQGPDTDRRTVLEIRDAIREERPCQVRILNYTKERKPFWNLFHLAPLYSRENGMVVHFVGVQTPLSKNFEEDAGDWGDVSHSLLQSAEKRDVIDENQKAADHENFEASNALAQKDGEIIRTDQIVEPSSQLNDGGLDVEGNFDVEEEEKRKAATAVRSVVSELTKSSESKGGIAVERSISLAQSGSVGVVCSSLMLSLTHIQQSFVLADPNLPDMPIVHASDLFLHLTGYSREEVVGRNCRFLQGPGTDPKSVQEIRESIKHSKPCSVRILNYRKDKQAFWNFLHVAPVRNADGKVSYFVGVQLDVTLIETPEHERESRSAHLKQLGAIGAIRVAVRGLQGSGLRRVQKL
uniref:Putative LOV domain-containing protein n=1 Tax=Pseudolycopodiella caroliniana TaxID=89042 RepID=A0A126X2G6_9TRAC|nr:putative LOV domain-containing protein [Pseudolycopodiella caroliniana]